MAIKILKYFLVALLAIHAKAQTVVTVDQSGCGSTKGCFADPDGCTGTACKMLVTYKENAGNADLVDFEMVLNDQSLQYVALGFSSGGGMASSPVIQCVRDGSTVQIAQSYNDGYSNNEFTTQATLGITNEMKSYSNGQLACSFTRSKTVQAQSNQNQFADLNNEYYLLLAMGTASNFNKAQHQAKTRSAGMISVTSTGSAGAGKIINKMYQIHGSLMIVAWIILASIGIILARYYKDVWDESKLCGEKVWFAIHRACMILTLLCVVAAFVIIFVENKGYNKVSSTSKVVNIHPWLGIVVTALCVINPIMALFRPHPGTANRYIFNWAHWGVGTIAYIAAQLMIYLGLRLPASEDMAPDWLIWLMVAFNAFHVLVEVILEIHRCTKSKRSGSNSMEMKDMGNGHAGQSSSSQSGDTFRVALIVIYMLVAVGLGAALVIVINIQ